MRNQPEPPIKVCRTLGEWPLPILRLRCSRCPQIRFFMTARLLRRYGPDVPLPELRHLLMGCDRKEIYDYCGVSFSDWKCLQRRPSPFGDLPINKTLPWREPR